MHFIAMNGYDVKPGRMAEYQKWLEANEKEMAQAMPPGCEYIGTFVAAQTSEKGAGQVFTLIRMESYGSQDALAAAGREPGPLHDLLNEAISFWDDDRSAGWSQIVLKKMVEATVYGD